MGDRCAQRGFTPLRRFAEHGFTPLRRFAEHGFTPLRRFAEHGFTPLRRFAEHGFTLIEIMVALAVFSLAALALVRLEGATVRGAASIDETLAAGMVARTVAAEAATDVRAPTLGSETGEANNGGRRWRWTRLVAPTADARVLRIDITVADTRGTQRGDATLVRSTIEAAR